MGYKYFHMEETMKTNTKKYDKNTLHKVLKTEFQFPAISSFLNCTFICNFIWNFDRINMDSLKEMEVFQKYQEIESIFLQNLDNFLVKTKPAVKKKKNKKDIKEMAVLVPDYAVNNEANDCDEFFDINNKFSVLKLF